LFRRERLFLTDEQIRQTLPEVLVMQEMMERTHSRSESDSKILSAGALTDYTFKTSSIKKYKDTSENELLGIAINNSVKILKHKNSQKTLEKWSKGDIDAISLLLMHENHPTLLFNISMASYSDAMPYDIEELATMIQNKADANSICPERVIVAGTFLEESYASSIYIKKFLNDLQLLDTTQSCNNINSCQTSSSINDIYDATLERNGKTQKNDKILISKHALIYSSYRVFDKGVSANKKYSSKFGLAKLWPSQRFGWSASFRLPVCQNNVGL
jgi:hypothetical protein